MRSADPHEQLAAEIVASILDGKATYIDHGAASSTVDFVLRTATASTIALEVSRILEQEYLEVAAAFAEPVDAPGLLQQWHLVLLRDAPIRRIKREVAAILASFEQAGGEVFSASVPPAEADPAVTEDLRERMRALRINAAHIESAGNPATITAQWGEWTSGPLPPVASNRAVEDAARSNCEKLRLADADERHLFVWVDGLAPHGAARAFVPDHEWGTADEPPELPAGIDVVWAAIALELARTRAGTPIFPSARQAPEIVEFVPGVWRARPPSRWELLGDVRLG